MIRKLMWLVLLTVPPANAAPNPVSVSGHVRDAHGVPQMGATVQISTAAAALISVHTDAQGLFVAPALIPGTYTIKVTAPSFLPSVLQNLSLAPGGTLILDITLNTLFQAIEALPRRNSPAADDDWRWTLRTATNRPILRFAQNAPTAAAAQNTGDSPGSLKARLAFLTGGEDGMASSQGTLLQLQQSGVAGGNISFNGNLNYGPGIPETALRAAYSYELPDGSHPELTMSMRRFDSETLAGGPAVVQALTLAVSNTTALSKSVEIGYGTNLQMVQFIRRMGAVRPFARADWHVNSNTVVEYRYATSPSHTDSGSAALSKVSVVDGSDPRVTIANGQAELEHSGHHEVSISHRAGKNKFQVAVFHDRVSNALLNGVGAAGAFPDVVPDIFANTFAYNGGSFTSNGLRAVFERKLCERWQGTLDYAYGSALRLPDQQWSWSAVPLMLRAQPGHSLAAKVSGRFSRGTWLLVSYRWVGGDALTPVDMFNVSAGYTDPYLSISVRQPLPKHRFLWPAGTEALIDARNLLAEGYRSVYGQDNQSVYLVQVARSIRGGVAFTF